jgi:hypothetical protein
VNNVATDVHRIHQLWQEKLAADPWNGWRALLAGWEIEGVKVPVDANTPFQGYYRTKRKDKTYQPVAYWLEDGTWKCLIDGKLIEPDRAIEQWPFISRYPISRAWYVTVAEKGEPWPDADERVTSQALAVSAERPADAPAPMGHNEPPEEMPIDALRNKIENAKGGIPDYKLIRDDEKLAKAKSLKNRLTELAGEAKKEREKRSRPHLDALDEIRAEWSPLVDDATAAAKTVNNSMDEWATEKLKIQRKAEAEADQRKRDAEKIEAENASKLREAEEAGKPAPKLQEVPKVEEAPPPSVEGTVVRPGYGRAGRTQTYWALVEITDYDALFGILKTHKELRDKMAELAQRAKDAGIEPPGCKFEERAKIKG